MSFAACKNENKIKNEDVYKDYKTFSFKGNFTYKVPEEWVADDIDDDSHTFHVNQFDSRKGALQVSIEKESSNVTLDDVIDDTVKYLEKDDEHNIENVETSKIKVAGKKTRRITYQQETEGQIYYIDMVMVDCKDGVAMFLMIAPRENEYCKIYDNILASVDLK